MEGSEISLHQLRVYEFVRNSSRWVTAAEIQEGAGVAPRTARHHLHKLASLGIVEQFAVFPGHRYRIAPTAEQSAPEYLARLAQAREVFGEVV